MIKASLKSLWAHKRRLLGTCLAVFLGVSFLSGTLVLGDTLRANFADLFTTANAGTDAVIRSASTIASSDRGEPRQTDRRLLDASLAGKIRLVAGVAKAEPSIEGFGLILGRNGMPIGGRGPPTLAGNWVNDVALNPYRLAEGRAPQTDDEVVINRGAASKGKLKLADTITVQTPAPVRVKISGIATFGSAEGLGQATFAGFTLGGAERYITKTFGEVSSISVKAAPGISQAELVSRIRKVLPRGVTAITGAGLTNETTGQINKQFLNLLTSFLNIFAGVALVVATFSIYNTFTILVAQRTRESALFRALGAGRTQVLAAVLVEALIVGLLGSAAGVGGGFAVAGLLKGLFDSFGFALPAGGLVLKTTTIVAPVTLGIAITSLAGLIPAVKASRVPPLAAMRDVAVDRTNASVGRAIAGVLILGSGVVVVLFAAIKHGSNALARTGLGAALTIFGMVVLGPVAAGMSAGVIGSPLPRLRGITGALARRNAMRNPRRTSGTAAALMVGVSIVSLFTVFAASLKASVDQTVSRSFGGDLAIRASGFGRGGLSPQLAGAIGRLGEVRYAAGIGQGVAQIDGKGRRVSVSDPTVLSRVLDVGVQQGSLEHLAPQQFAVSEKTAKDRKLHLGSKVDVVFVDGFASSLSVGAVYKSPDIAGDYLLRREEWAPHSLQDADSLVLIKLYQDTNATTAKAKIKALAAPFGAPQVQDRMEFADSIGQRINTLLGIIYVLLALAIIIALMGIANTLSLSVHERTRELGLLRAVGETRGQLRSMIRWESVIIATFGTLGGLGLGLFLGWALVQAASQDGAIPFTAPISQLAAVLVTGALAGVLAGVRPARRAAKLNALRAIASS